MSNFLAIATVTAGLRHALGPVVATAVPGASVTTMRPDAPANGTPDPRVNLYLFQTTPNAAWRNADVPTRRTDGALVQRPQVALDLHYLVTFYGDDGQLEPQRLLGSVVRTLHAAPVLTRQTIQSTIADPTFSFLVASDLADAVELVKFTPIALPLEELSKLWSVFLQTPYTLSVAYLGTVVLIESEDTPQPAPPVRTRNLYAAPFRQPVIARIRSQAGAGQPILDDAPILAGHTLVLVGQRLRGETTMVRIGGLEVTPAPDAVSDAQISVPLPAGLRAGPQGVQVVQPALLGTPPLVHAGVESNVAAFVLHPTIAATVAHVSSRTVDGVTLSSDDVTVDFTPPVGRTQRVVLLLNEFDAPANRAARAYSFPAPPRRQPGTPEQAGSLTIRVTDVVPGAYVIRVQVDGAESPLGVNAGGQYASPVITI